MAKTKADKTVFRISDHQASGKTVFKISVNTPMVTVAKLEGPRLLIRLNFVCWRTIRIGTIEKQEIIADE
jgi:hypothetical protein